MVSAPDRRAWLTGLPKVELHLHLEGAIPLPALFRLVEKYGDDEVDDMAALEARFRYSSFGEFLATWHWKNRFLREYEDFEWIGEAVAQALRAQNVVRCEAFFSPRDFEHHGLALGELAAALRRGVDAVDGIDVALVCDLVRDTGPLVGATTLDEVLDVAGDAGIVGVGIGGSEEGFPPELFRDVYAKARESGLRRTAHAGEASGPASVWGALAIGAERIGHGIRAADDPSLMDHLAEERVALEVCPLSNLATGVVEDPALHPVRVLFDAGIPVTINTDDPGMFGNSLTDDLAFLMDHHGFTASEIRTILETGVEAAWVDGEERDRLRRVFASFEGW